MKMEKYQRVYAQVDLDAILTNMRNMKNNIHPETKMIGVIKADGYGHGSVPIARELEKEPYMFGFATATVEEAVILRKSGSKLPILILGYTFPYCYETLAEMDIRPTVFKSDMLKQLSETAKRLSKTIKIHIKVDTGMSRIGIRPDEDGLSFVKEAMNTEGIEIEGLFTHFARADEKDKSAANEQLRKYKEFVERIETELGIIIPIKHCSNSAGILELPEANLDVVRAGITLYGLWPSEEVSKETLPLLPALSMFSHIVYIKELEKGSAVSYGGTYVADSNRRVATIPVGYADGYPRGLSGKGYVLIHGKKAPILGRVCMDQFMVDITDIPEAKEGDLITLIGKEGDEAITVEDLGDLSGRFNYELVCDIGKRVPRVYIKDGKIIGTKDYNEDFN